MHLAPLVGRGVPRRSGCALEETQRLFLWSTARGRALGGACGSGSSGTLRGPAAAGASWARSLDAVRGRVRRAGRGRRWRSRRRCSTCCGARTTGSTRGSSSPEGTLTTTMAPRRRPHPRALDHPGHFHERERAACGATTRERAFTVGIGGPVGSGKTALVLALCRRAARPPQPRRGDQRHLHPRGRRVPRSATRRCPPSASARWRRAAARTRRSARTSATTCSRSSS